ncbi:dihydroxyacetone kinase DhaK subunit [Haloactinospora alba]|uniref:Dihydroxyacetone kinase DhaK subunit n=1 Tax=Haloactinospora alba TaxID=405555 RepID=A0A543NLA8_9ACTN|nr:dihydroxyacetone kinase subunit DhaK [Haloactinospora alba]TQN32596.1 dihydroxyacetone kinase DhaK subunit [Haloactinospora alba]
MKKFLNDPDQVITDTLTGLAAVHAELTVDTERRIVTRARPAPGKVALVSGGGSGHEPLHAGFVGPGMLDAACPGEVFTSPVPDQVSAAVAATDTGPGVLFVVKNYTGDVLNFEMAAELAGEDSVATETVLVNDDVAVRDSTFTAGRRGTGATLLVEKMAGALAERGAPLASVAEMGRRVNDASRSFALALTACTTPASGRPGFTLAEDEIEVGVGIHGEPGRSRERMRPSRDLAAVLVESVLDDMPRAADSPAIVLLNGMGGTPLHELYLLYGDVAAELRRRGVSVARTLVGNYVTSLDMAGASLTVCGADEEMLELWDAPVATPHLRWKV